MVYYMVLHVITWYTMILRGKLVCHAFLYVVYCNCMVCHGLPFTKQYGILTWNTMVYFHKGGKAMKMLYGFIHNLKIKYRL